MKLAYILVTLTSSFCTMAYTMILASLAAEITGDEVRSQCLIMGPYLFGLGIGSILSESVTVSRARALIFRLEWISVCVLPFIPVISYLGLLFYQHFSGIGVTLDQPASINCIFLFSAILSLLTGFLGGAQLPLIMKDRVGISDEVILAVNYMGPLAAGIYIVSLTSAAVSVSLQILGAGFIQIAGLTALIFTWEKKSRYLASLFVPLFLLLGSAWVYPTLETWTLKSVYFGMKSQFSDVLNPGPTINVMRRFGSLERVRTPYQTIDLLIEPPQEEYGVPGNASLFLNRKPQFDLFSIDVYHESMVFGGINLLGRTPERVLILGGGDGILLNVFRRVKNISKITLIELDPGMIEFSRDNNVVASMNEGVLSALPANVELVLDDAIRFLRTYRGEGFDLILVDFPFPHGQDLAKLYSKEFYTLLKKASGPDSLYVIDLPFYTDPDGELSETSRTIMKTMTSAGLGKFLPFGPHASFVAVSSLQKPAFAYDKFPADLDLTSALNFLPLEHLDHLSPALWKKTPVNTMFWPRIK